MNNLMNPTIIPTKKNSYIKMLIAESGKRQIWLAEQLSTKEEIVHTSQLSYAINGKNEELLDRAIAFLEEYITNQKAA